MDVNCCWQVFSATMPKLDRLQSLVSNDLRRIKRAPFGLSAAALSAPLESGFQVPSLAVFDSFYINGIVGGYNPSEYSESPMLWNVYFKETKKKGIFFPFDLPLEEDLGSFLATLLETPGFLELTVTDPYKLRAFVELQSMGISVTFSEQAANLGVVNHIIMDKRKTCLKALNTDGLGMIQAIRKKINLQGKKALLIGAGGASASIGYELVKYGADIFIANRTGEKAEKLCRFFNKFKSSSQKIGYGALDNIQNPLADSDLIVSTISGRVVIDFSTVVKSEALLAESTYGEKALLFSLAEKLGNPYVGGREMLFGQFLEATKTVFPLLGLTTEDNQKVLLHIEQDFL